MEGCLSVSQTFFDHIFEHELRWQLLSFMDPRMLDFLFGFKA